MKKYKCSTCNEKNATIKYKFKKYCCSYDCLPEKLNFKNIESLIKWIKNYKELTLLKNDSSGEINNIIASENSNAIDYIPYLNKNVFNIELKKLSRELHIKVNSIIKTLYSNESEQNYHKLEISKRNGGIRKIHAVTGYLKFLQRKINDHLQIQFKPSKYAFGFVKGKGIIENAKKHKNKKIIIKLDIKDFFPSITFPRVRGMFQAQPFNFNQQKATLLAQICCLKHENGCGPIPQGGITSPYISNMICRKLDSRISNLGRKERFTFTRYADDITISTDKNIDVKEILEYIRNIIKEEHFEVNENKTRIMKKSDRQVVTGIIVNEGLNVNKKYIKNLRGILHSCYNKGTYNYFSNKIIMDDYLVDDPESKPEIKKSYQTCPNIYFDNGVYTFIKTYTNDKRYFIDENTLLDEFYKKNNSYFKIRSKDKPVALSELGTKEYIEVVKNPYLAIEDKKIKLSKKYPKNINKTWRGTKKVTTVLLLQHLKGRINFLGQVAKANTNKDINEKRMKTYSYFQKKYEQLVHKENIYDDIKFESNSLKKYQERESAIKQKEQINSLGENEALQAVIKQFGRKDPRFYQYNIKTNLEVEKNKKEIINIIFFPAFDQKHYYNWIRNMKNSTDHFLGIVVHKQENPNLTWPDILQFSKEFNDIKFFINNDRFSIFNARDKFNLFIKAITNKATKINEKYMDFWGDKEFRKRIIIPFKKEHRIMKTGIATRPEDFEKNIKKEFKEKEIDFRWDISDSGFYGPITIIEKQIIACCHSMFMPEREKKIMIHLSEQDEKVIIRIHGDNCSNVDIKDSDNRDFAHAKITNIIRALNGLCDYDIYIRNKNTEFKKINMMKADDIENCKNLSFENSFTHEFSFEKI